MDKKLIVDTEDGNDHPSPRIAGCNGPMGMGVAITGTMSTLSGNLVTSSLFANGEITVARAPHCVCSCLVCKPALDDLNKRVIHLEQSNADRYTIQCETTKIITEELKSISERDKDVHDRVQGIFDLMQKTLDKVTVLEEMKDALQKEFKALMSAADNKEFVPGGIIDREMNKKYHLFHLNKPGPAIAVAKKPDLEKLIDIFAVAAADNQSDNVIAAKRNDDGAWTKDRKSTDNRGSAYRQAIASEKACYLIAYLE